MEHGTVNLSVIVWALYVYGGRDKQKEKGFRLLHYKSEAAGSFTDPVPEFFNFQEVFLTLWASFPLSVNVRGGLAGT